MESPVAAPRFATIALAGRPNAGKSTLLNALVGEPLAAVSAKPQTTREPVVGIVTDGQTQLAFVDPPGLLEPRYTLHEAMMSSALRSLAGADAVLYLHPINDGEPPPLQTLLPEGTTLRAPVATVLTKADLAPHTSDLEAESLDAQRSAAEKPPETFTVSATTGLGVDRLLAWCRRQAAPGPFRYPPEDVSAQPLRFFAAEYVREAGFDVLGQELPYAIAPVVDEFRESETPVYIRVLLYVERESQKGMVVGKGGRTIKRLGAAARRRIEALMGQPVYLDLWVKVWPKWRRSAAAMRQLGFTVPPEGSS